MPLKDWRPPADWQRVTTIDLHTAGEPFRVITGGYPELPGATILEKRRYAHENLDHLRTALMFEPRGHADMYGCIVTPPVSDGADFGVLFMHNEGYSSMCGHGIIAIATAAVECGVVTAVEPETKICIDSPAGPITAFVRVHEGRPAGVRFHNVPSFVFTLGDRVEVPKLGTVHYDIAYGGAFYAYVKAADVGLQCIPGHFRTLIERGTMIKKAIMAAREVEHPYEHELGFLYGVVFVDEAEPDEVHSRNVCVFADGEVDRSPTGTSVSAQMALLHARDEVQSETLTFESLIGSRFTGRVVDDTTFGPYEAVIPEVSGAAHITGRHEFILDPDDELKHGFLLR